MKPMLPASIADLRHGETIWRLHSEERCSDCEIAEGLRVHIDHVRHVIDTTNAWLRVARRFAAKPTPSSEPVTA